MTITNNFIFNNGDAVVIVPTNKAGQVRGRADSMGGTAQYEVQTVNSSNQVEKHWFDADLIAAAPVVVDPPQAGA